MGPGIQVLSDRNWFISKRKGRRIAALFFLKSLASRIFHLRILNFISVLQSTVSEGLISIFTNGSGQMALLTA